MKLFEIRLYDLKIIKDDNVIFEGKSEEVPDELRNEEIKSITLENGIAIIIL